MANEYSFKQKTCYCGLDLTDKKAAVVGYRRGLTPVGECPGCGRSLVLDAPALEHPLDEPEIKELPSPKKGGGKAKPEAKPKPEPAPEPEPE